MVPKTIRVQLAALLIAGVAPAPGPGRGEELTAKEIVRLVRVQDNAIDDETADMEIRSEDASGVKRNSALRLYWKTSRGTKGLLGQTLLVTLSPKNRKGEGFLLWQAERASESQAWLYLPDLRQALRITVAGQDAQRPSRKADMLLGFEQLGARLLGEGDRVLVGRDEGSGAAYLILEERLTGEPAGTRRFWVSPEHWTIAKIEYRDASGRVELSQNIEWQQVGGAWVWKRVEVRAANPPGHTVVELRNVKVNTGLSDRLFTVNALKAGTFP